MTNNVRLSATIPKDLMQFLDSYQHQHSLKSRSAALAIAIKVLREKGLQEAYEELGQAQQTFPNMYPADNTDGLDNNDSQQWQ